MPDPVYIDTETRNRVPIFHGNELYTRTAECMIVTWARGDKPAQGWDKMEPGWLMPNELDDILRDDRIPLIAHQAPFDHNIITHALGIPTPIERWRCTRAQAYSHGLPGSLELLGIVLGLPQDQQKLVEDSRLIQTFCVPREDGSFIQPSDEPEKWERFYNYGLRDTEALRAIHHKLPTHNYSGQNLAVWWLDQKINERGFGFDAKLAQAAVEFLKIAKDKHDADISNQTLGAVTALTQRDRLLRYLTQHCELDIANLRAAEIRDYLERDDISPEVRFILEARLEGAKSSGSKYRKGLQSRGAQGRIRWSLQFGGAGRTGRWSGKGYQPHNMARPVVLVSKPDGSSDLVPVKAKYIDEVIIPGIYSKQALDFREVFGGPNEACALALRHAIVAAPGNELVVGDWSNIESRVLAWIADEQWKLAAYRATDAGTGADLYKLLFSQFFGTPVEQVNDTERQGGKVSELAFGFGGGVGALVTMAATYNMDLDPLAALVLPRANDTMKRKAYKAWRRAFLTNEDYELEPDVYQACDVLKQTYRASNAAINQMRYDLDNAIKSAIRQPGTSYRVAKCLIWSTGAMLIIQLPSGRRLVYANPKIHSEEIQDADTGKPIRREYVSYATARGMSWRRERAWSGLFVENIVQALANDVLRAKLLELDADTKSIPAVEEYLDTLPADEQTAICLHVHDEPVLDLPIGLYPLERMLKVITGALSWAPGLPLAAGGWVGPRYGKRG